MCWKIDLIKYLSVISIFIRIPVGENVLVYQRVSVVNYVQIKLCFFFSRELKIYHKSRQCTETLVIYFNFLENGSLTWGRFPTGNRKIFAIYVPNLIYHMWKQEILDVLRCWLQSEILSSSLCSTRVSMFRDLITSHVLLRYTEGHVCGYVQIYL